MKITALFAAVPLLAAAAYAQTAAVADLQQDMALLRREVGQLRLEVEQLRRENEELSCRLKGVQSSTVGSETVRQQVSLVKSEVGAQNESLKREIIALVKKDLEAMAAQTNANIQKLAAAIGTRPQADLPANFSDDYPKTGRHLYRPIRRLHKQNRPQDELAHKVDSGREQNLRPFARPARRRRNFRTAKIG